MKKQVTAWAPATIANLNVGFDGLGCAIAAPGEKIRAERTDAHNSVRIVHMEGPGALSMDPERNVAGRAAASLWRALNPGFGLDLSVYKEIKPGSGIGSSAASAAAAVVAVDGLLGAGLRPDELLPFALDGEVLASGARHADNVAPALMGGLVLCPPEGRPMGIPLPASWPVLIVHPQIEILTANAREVLPREVPFEAAVDQARWLGTFIAACASGDGETALFAMEDLLVTPHRAALIPQFAEVRLAAFAAGARAGGISGSGPSTFWLGTQAETMTGLEHAVRSIYEKANISVDCHSTQISLRGAHLVA